MRHDSRKEQMPRANEQEVEAADYSSFPCLIRMLVSPPSPVIITIMLSVRRIELETFGVLMMFAGLSVAIYQSRTLS